MAVCTGGEMGPWQQREAYTALERQVAAERTGAAFPVIPVLLPGAESPLGLKLRDVVERVLARQPGMQRLLPIVDQWEELLTAPHG